MHLATTLLGIGLLTAQAWGFRSATAGRKLASQKIPSGLNVFLPASGYCEGTDKSCHEGCIPFDGVCCEGFGYCKRGNYCTDTGGCCPNGAVCSGVGSCGDDEEECGQSCMPEGKVCCLGSFGGAGGYCDQGESCGPDNTCLAGDSGGSGDDSDEYDDSTGGSGSGSSCNYGYETCDSIYCMIEGGECCASGDGSYCDPGTYCDRHGGCCPDGEICRKGDWSTSTTEFTGLFTSSTITYLDAESTSSDATTFDRPSPTTTYGPGFGGSHDDDSTETTTAFTKSSSGPASTTTATTQSADDSDGDSTNTSGGNNGDDDNNNTAGETANDDTGAGGRVQIQTIPVFLAAVAPVLMLL